MEGQQVSLDRITCLPPTIIETILCLLPIQEAGRTSILSRDWRYKWTKIPELGFYEHMFEVSKHEDEQSDMEQHEDEQSDMEQPYIPWERKDMSKRFKLFYAIYQVLLAHRGPIVEFSLSVNRTDDTCVEIDQIIAHLSRTNTVEILSLELGNDYRLPLSIFSMHQLRDLYLYMGEINHQPTFNGFENLTSLYLDSVNISRKVLLHLLSKCPILKSVGLLLYLEDNIPANDNSTIFELFEKVYTQAEIDAVKLQDYSDIRLEHLSKLKITNFSNFKPEMVFLKHILANSPVLKKASIVLDSMVAKNEHLQISRILSHYPCASPVVEISVKHSD
ncbi:F-box/FBD/LRR-repeat protein-like protein isoform X2 [Tanacetum coccineum]